MNTRIRMGSAVAWIVAIVVAVILNAVLPSEEHFLSAPKEAPAADAE